MSVFLGSLALLLFLVGLVTAFLRLNPAHMASALRLAGPVTVAIIGAVVLLTGRAAVGGMIMTGALAWYRMAGSKTATAARTPGKRSTVRTAALEMELDHDTGGLEGMVLAGRHESKILSAMTQAQLLELYAELPGDPESRQLLETYLDGRFPVWRDDAKANGGDRHGVAPGSGAMTKEEAYKVLGLEAGAAAADIRKAHRRLMQRLHPDLGGTSFLAARINEAKDVLLSNHG